MSKILLPAQFDGYSNKKDKTVSLRFVTQEQTPGGIAIIHGLLDQFGYLYWKPEANGMMSEAEKAELDGLETDLFDNPKTQSQRIRNVLYRTWEQHPDGFADFREYYKFKTDQIINHLKTKLDP